MAMRYWSIYFLLFILVWPGSSIGADHEQARSLYRQGCALVQDDPAQAERLFHQAISAMPTYDRYFALGSVQMKQGKYESSKQSFDKAYTYGVDQSELAEAMAMGGQALAAMGKGHKGLQEIEKALENHPDPPAWIKQVALAIEDDNAGKIVSADEINSCLDPPEGRGVAITPKIDLPVRFTYDQYELDSQGKEQVKELAKALGSGTLKDARFQVIGHTDLQGDRQYNQRLSVQRAKTVVRILEQLQPELRGNLQAIGRGMSEPRRREINEKAHRINRRVEVVKVEG